MLPKFIKVFPHEFKRVMGIKRVPHAVEAAHAAPASVVTAPEPGNAEFGSRVRNA